MKKILYIILIIFLIFSFSISSFSYEFDEEIMDSLDKITKEYLSELGIDKISFEELFDLSPMRVIKFITSLAFEKTTSLIDRFTLIFIVMIISAIATSFLNENKQLNNIVNYISILLILSFIMTSISRVITDAAVSMRTSNVFISVYLPIMIGIIVASRNPALAVTYNTFTIFLSNIISFVSDKLLLPLISVIFSFNIISTFSADNYHLRINKIIRRFIVVILSLFSTLFTGLLTTQSILATSTDSFALKGIKFMSGAFIPVIGGNVSEAVSSIISSFVIMKSTLGVFIIIVIILINLPVMIELLVWYFFLGLCSMISALLKLETITDTFDCLASTISLLNIAVFFVTFVLVISTGVIIIMGK